jgi:UDPglucose--hexose-1-phosphate uridylyltransferase
MPELRKDPVSNRWVIISTERGNRPTDFQNRNEHSTANTCPFCYGNEKETPFEIAAISSIKREPDTPGWDVRVIPNKYKALILEGELNREGVGIFDKMNGIGTHEVIIESPDHNANLADMSVEHISKIIKIYQKRIIDLYKDLRFRYILIFRNFGESAGASLTHPHTQIIATPTTPVSVKVELDAARNYYYDKERCIFCDIIKQEISLKDRIILENDHFVSLAPFASRFPFEATILPKRHMSNFSCIPEDLFDSLAFVLKDTMSRIKVVLNNPAYNYLIHTVPNTQSWKRRSNYWETIDVDYHWHIEIIPRLTRIAGFEWGTGFYINPTLPEDAAKLLRNNGKIQNN